MTAAPAREHRGSARHCAAPARAPGWHVERVTGLMAGSFTLVSLGLGRRDPRWRLLAGLIGTNLVAQALVGWCPASYLMHRLGLRTAAQRAVEG